MASMDCMREYVSKQYGGGWPERVRKMPDYQVMAIYHTMMRELDKTREKPVEPKLTETEVRGGVQLSFFEGNSMEIKEGYFK